MKALSITALILLFLSQTVIAQNFRIGLTTGFNTNIVLDEGLKSDPRYEADYNYTFAPIGIAATLEITRSWGIAAEAMIVRTETAYDIIDASESVKGQQILNIKGVNIPIFLKYMSGGDGTARFNFNFGPQLAFLNSATESFTSEAGIFNIPDGTSFNEIQDLFPSATQNPEQQANETYEIPNEINANVLESELEEFKKLDFQLALAMGMDFDIGRHLILSTQIRMNYSINGVSNEDAFNRLLAGDAGQLFAEKASLGIGIQVGIHYSFSITRAFARKEAASRVE